MSLFWCVNVIPGEGVFLSILLVFIASNLTPVYINISQEYLFTLLYKVPAIASVAKTQ